MTPKHLAAMHRMLTSVRIYQNRFVPLTKVDPDTGEEKALAFMEINGEIHMHPDRYAQLMKEIESQ